MKAEEFALILIDVQRDFWRPYSALPRFNTFPENIRSLLSESRKRGLTIIHTQAYFRLDRSDWMLFYRPQGRGIVPCVEGTEGVEFELFAKPIQGEPVVRKQTFDGFLDTDLAKILVERGIKAMFIGGLETSVCVLFTANSAYLRRFVPIVVSDACADEPMKHDWVLKEYGGLSFLTTNISEVQRHFDDIIKRIEPLMRVRDATD